jgi:hypothetical protein
VGQDDALILQQDAQDDVHGLIREAAGVRCAAKRGRRGVGDHLQPFIREDAKADGFGNGHHAYL